MTVQPTNQPANTCDVTSTRQGNHVHSRKERTLSDKFSGAVPAIDDEDQPMVWPHFFTKMACHGEDATKRRLQLCHRTANEFQPLARVDTKHGEDGHNTVRHPPPTTISWQFVPDRHILEAHLPFPIIAADGDPTR